MSKAEKEKKNISYLKHLNQSFDQLEENKTITFSMSELKAMESEDWRPTQKVKDFVGEEQL